MPSPICASRARWPSCWSSSISISPARWPTRYAVMERGEVVLAGTGRDGRKRRSALPYRLTDGVSGLAEATPDAAGRGPGCQRYGRVRVPARSWRAAARRRHRTRQRLCTRPVRRRGRAFPNPVNGAARSGPAQHGGRADRRRPHRRRGGAGARREATVTTAAAEKIYRSRGDADRIGMKLAAGRRRATRAGCRSRPSVRQSRLRSPHRVDMRGDATPARGRDPDLRPHGHGRGRAPRRLSATPGACAATAPGIRRYVRASSGAVAACARPAGARSTARAPRPCSSMSRPTPAARLDDGARAARRVPRATAGASSLERHAAGARRRRAMAATLQRDLAPLIVRLSGRPLPRVWQC